MQYRSHPNACPYPLETDAVWQLLDLSVPFVKEDGTLETDPKTR